MDASLPSDGGSSDKRVSVGVAYGCKAIWTSVGPRLFWMGACLCLVTPQGSHPASSSRAAMFMQVTPLKSTGLPGCEAFEKGLENEALRMQWANVCGYLLSW